MVAVVALISELGSKMYPLVWAAICASRTWEGSGERLCAESTRNADKTAENRPACGVQPVQIAHENTS